MGRGRWVACWSSMLAQRAVAEGWEVQPGRPPARGTRAIGMCSFDARNGRSIRTPSEEVNERAWKNGKGAGSLRVLSVLAEAARSEGSSSIRAVEPPPPAPPK